MNYICYSEKIYEYVCILLNRLYFFYTYLKFVFVVMLELVKLLFKNVCLYLRIEFFLEYYKKIL